MSNYEQATPAPDFWSDPVNRETAEYVGRTVLDAIRFRVASRMLQAENEHLRKLVTEERMDKASVVEALREQTTYGEQIAAGLRDAEARLAEATTMPVRARKPRTVAAPAPKGPPPEPQPTKTPKRRTRQRHPGQ